MRISDWSSDVCSSDLAVERDPRGGVDRDGTRDRGFRAARPIAGGAAVGAADRDAEVDGDVLGIDARIEDDLVAGRGGRERVRNVVIGVRSEEHTSELQSLMRISYAVFCLTKTKQI